MKTTVLTAAILAAFATMAFAAPARKHAMHMPAAHHKAVKKTALICPVTGNKIASVKDAVGHSSYKGKTYYFCCPDCKPKFDKNPAKYVANSAKGKFDKM